MKTLDAPLALNDRQFGTAEIVAMSDVPDKHIRNWLHRGVLDVGEVHFSGRRLYSFADALRLAVMHDLTARVPLKPSDAVEAAKYYMQQIEEAAPRNTAGQPIVDVSSIPATRAIALAMVDGELRGGLIDPAREGYADWRGEWGAAHVVLPIAPLFAAVQWRAIDILVARAGAK